MKFSIKEFFSKCDQIRSFLRIWSHLLKKSLMENFFFCAVSEEDNFSLGKYFLFKNTSFLVFLRIISGDTWEDGIALRKKVSVFGVILIRIQSKCQKIRTTITQNTDTFHAVLVALPYPLLLHHWATNWLSIE